jgi:hypothetical protein
MKTYKGTRVVPVLSPNIASIISRNSATVDDYAENAETDHSRDFDDGKDKFCLTIAADAEKVDHDDEKQENGHPRGAIGVLTTGPKLQGEGGGHDFQG